MRQKNTVLKVDETITKWKIASKNMRNKTGKQTWQPGKPGWIYQAGCLPGVPRDRSAQKTSFLKEPIQQHTGTKIT